MDSNEYILWFDTVGNEDVSLVGGKNASLGELTRNLIEKNIRVPFGFATTAGAYLKFIQDNALGDRIASLLKDLNAGRAELAVVGESIRRLILEAPIPEALGAEICFAYRELSGRYGTNEVDVAVRSSATAEDLPEASFAGQHESFLNVRGEDALLETCVKCFASLFTDRAISYRNTLGIDHMDVALSVGVQKMVRADGAGVLFTLDTETGFPDVVLINGAWGLGENVVKGSVTPDQYVVFKPLLELSGLKPIIEKSVGTKKHKLVYVAHDKAGAGTSGSTKNLPTTKEERKAFVLSDEELLTLARWGVSIERHYGRPMDIEWARDGEDGELYVVQARPETVHSRRKAAALKSYRLTSQGRRLVEGLPIGDAIAAGRVSRIDSAAEIDRFVEGAVLVTETTDPDWGPIMKKAAGIVTDHGGRTSHAAIVSRELGIPAIVGAGNATEMLGEGQEITLSCAEGDRGYVYEGMLPFEVDEIDLENAPETNTQIMINIASPAAAMRWWRLPARGVGLARMEYLINNVIKIHPMALARFDDLADEKEKERIAALTGTYIDKPAYFVDHLARGIATIAASQYPEHVIVRTSDFKTNEYARLIGGAAFEPEEENPMLGWRGAARYYSDAYRDGFALECRALKKVREEMGFSNVIVMIPFCRTLEEADRVLEVMAENGLRRGDAGLEIYVMAEIPSNVILAEEFAKRFDGFSIGSNDLTQLTLGVDRDSERLAYLFDERDEAVKRFVRELIDKAHNAGRPVGICGQGPSDHPDFAEFLVEAGIDSISLLPDSVMSVLRMVNEVEKRRALMVENH